MMNGNNCFQIFLELITINVRTNQRDYITYIKNDNAIILNMSRKYAKIDKVDYHNNKNIQQKTLEDKEDQKNASKLKAEIDREIKSAIYNIQKSENKLIKLT